MGIHGTRYNLLVLVIALALRSVAFADLTISGTKDFSFRDFALQGSLNQFLADNPTFLTDRGFNQSLRLDVSGTLGKSVSIDATFDDTFDRDQNNKMLMSAKGNDWAVTAGRLTLELPGTRYLIFNKKSLGLVADYATGRHRLRVLGGRPEGDSVRDFFKGQGAIKSYVVTHRPMVQGSEIVQLDGRLLVRGVDYDVDYDEGTVSLSSRLLPVEATSRVTIEYEALSTGSSFNSTVLGVRDVISIPSARLSTSTSSPLEVGVAALVSKDSDAPGTPTTATPQQLIVLGADITALLPRGFKVSGELASSFLDPNTRLTTPDQKGTAYDLTLARRSPGWDFKVSEQRLGSAFQAIGKKQFVRLGEAQDLASDLQLTHLDSRYDLSRQFFLDTQMDVSRSNLSGRLDLDTRRFFSLTDMLTYERGPDARVTVRDRLENDRADRGGTATADARRDDRTGTLSWPLTQNLVGQLKADAQGERGTSPATLGNPAGSALQLSANLSRPRGKKFRWSAGLEGDKSDDPLGNLIKRATSEQMMLDWTPLPALAASLSLLTRQERDLVAGTHDSVNTGELKSRYHPSERLTINVKAAAEERNTILTAAALNPQLSFLLINPLAPRTQVVQAPALTTTQNHVIEYEPSKQWDHRLSFRDRAERDVNTGTLYSDNQGLGYRLKWARDEKFRSTSEVEVGRFFAGQQHMDRNTLLANQEFLWSFHKNLNLTLAGSDNDSHDRSGSGIDKTVQESLGLERILNAYFTALAKISHTRKDQGGHEDDDAGSAGIRYSPPKMHLSTQLDIELGHTQGVEPNLVPFTGHKNKLGLKVNGNPTRDLTVNATVQYVDTGPDAAGNPGYRALITETKVFLQF